MLAADTLVATLIEEDTWIVAIVDDSITHQQRTLFPSSAFYIFLCIASRHSLDKTHTVATLYILLPRCNVHPSNQVTSRLHLQIVAIVAQPCRHTHTHVWPLIACALSISVHHYNTVVEPHLAFCKLCLTETSASNDLIYLLTGIIYEECLHGV